MPATNELLQEGRYRIHQPTDDNTTVFEAFDTVRNANVTVREIPVKLNKVTTPAQQESLRAAFAEQAKALSEVEHGTLLHVQDFFSEIDRQYLVMESVEGENLRKILADHGAPFTVAEVTAWADDLLDALNYLHSRRPSIFHLNIRPENLKLDASGRVRLAGFNLDTGDDSGVQPNEHELRYSPMEQIWPGLDVASQKVITNSYDDRSLRILKETPDARSDIYALGATLYFLITGVDPVDPLERSIEMLEGKLDPLREPSKVNSEVPPQISDVLMKALEIRRENRYDSAMIMRQVLQAEIAKLIEEGRQQSEPVNSTPQAAETKTASPPQPKKEVAEPSSPVVLMQANPAPVAADPPEPIFTAPRTDDNLLDIPISAEVMAYRDTNAVDEDELAAVLQELEAAEVQRAEPVRTILEMPSASETEVDVPVQVIERAVDVAPKDESANVDEDDDLILYEPMKSGFPLPMPAMIGAGVLGILIAVGAWFAMSGSTEPPAPQPSQTVQSAQPTVPEPSPSVEPSATPSEEVASASNTAVTEQSATAPKAAPTAKPKKADPAKPAAEKKKVTVDDLINDN